MLPTANCRSKKIFFILTYRQHPNRRSRANQDQAKKIQAQAPASYTKPQAWANHTRTVNDGEKDPSRSDEKLLEESMRIKQSPLDLSDCWQNQLQWQTLEDMLRLLEDETTNHNAIPATGQTFFDEKLKKK